MLSLRMPQAQAQPRQPAQPPTPTQPRRPAQQSTLDREGQILFPAWAGLQRPPSLTWPQLPVSPARIDVLQEMESDYQESLIEIQNLKQLSDANAARAEAATARADSEQRRLREEFTQAMQSKSRHLKEILAQHAKSSAEGEAARLRLVGQVGELLRECNALKEKAKSAAATEAELKGRLHKAEECKFGWRASAMQEAAGAAQQQAAEHQRQISELERRVKEKEEEKARAIREHETRIRELEEERRSNQSQIQRLSSEAAEEERERQRVLERMTELNDRLLVGAGERHHREMGRGLSLQPPRGIKRERSEDGAVAGVSGALAATVEGDGLATEVLRLKRRLTLIETERVMTLR